MTMMTSFGQTLILLLLIGGGAVHAESKLAPTTTEAPVRCATSNPCPGGTYCQDLPATEQNPIKCIETGYLYGNCSLNTIEMCAHGTSCLEKPDRKSYTCKCDDALAVGNGIRKDKGGTGCVLPFKDCQEDKDCPQYGHCDASVGYCKCDEGFQGNGFNCTDIKDCNPSNPMCDENAFCEDTPGNFTCTCNGAGNWQGNGSYCKHVCLSDNDCDRPRGRCTIDSVCECRPGYSGNGTHCVDVDECAEGGSHDCPAGADCINLPGGYDCKCKNGFFGDGRNCEELPKGCKEIANMKPKEIYLIDPDGTGPAKHFEVECDIMYGETVTILNPKGSFPISAFQGVDDVPIPYEPEGADIQPLLEKSGFCFQDIYFDCYRHFKLFPGTKWYDAFGKEHESWGTDTKHQCSCGELGLCDAGCYCDANPKNKWVVRDSAKIVDKGMLPVMRITFSAKSKLKGRIDVGPLVCMDTTAAIPKNCHDAKFNHKIKSNGPLVIDVDGTGPLNPFLAYCDMTSYTNVGITEIPPNSPVLNVTTVEGEAVNYRLPGDKMQGLISGSVYCAQSVEFECQHSKLMGSGGYVSVGSEKRKLNYFPGANGVQNTCGCGATKSCDQPQVTCNCNIDDDQVRKDFGLVIDKKDLPVVHVNAQYGGQSSSVYTVGPLKCAGRQFGIEPNCEKYRGTGVNEDYTYFVDPDGPAGELEPFLVECQFVQNPPQGKTIVHHENEILIALGAVPFDLKYLAVSPPQLDALKDRSTYCSQEVKVNCNNVKLAESNDIIQWQPANETNLISLLGFLSTCMDSNGCNCDGASTTKDNGEVIEMDYLPILNVNMDKIKAQIQAGGSGTVSVGPMICSEVFTTCAALHYFIKYGNALEGESAVENGMFTIDPDGAGGADPFEVKCQFPNTIVPLKPTTGEVGPDPNKPGEPISQCTTIQYQDEQGDPITPAQIDALVKRSGKCRQRLSLDCTNAPATGGANFTTCDGKTQTGWAGSRGREGCACGLSGICDGGLDAVCNCDLNDDKLHQDSGLILDTDRLPVCEVCITAPPLTGNKSSNNSATPMQRFSIGSLVCDGSPGFGKDCQAARSKDKGFSGEPQEKSVTLNIAGQNLPVGCKYYTNPPMGAMVVNPRELVYPPPDEDSTVNVTINYITFRIDLIKIAMRRNVYCRQKIFFFCVGNQKIETDTENGYYDDTGAVYGDWIKMAADSGDVQNACDQYPDLCSKCGKPEGYLVAKKQQLPVTSIILAAKGVTVVVDHVECLNMRRKCQELMDYNQLWYAKLPNSHNRFLLDPDGPLEGIPFVAKCLWYKGWKVGVTELPLGGYFTGKGKTNVQGEELPGQFEIPVEMQGVTPEQARSLAKISEFCWQNVKYECKYTPLLNDGQSPASYYYLNSSKPSTSWGTDEDVSATGCACGILGTCTTPDVTCNCDAKGPMGVDNGAITDKDVLPIVQVNVGGQTQDGASVDITMSPMQCGKLSVPPPRDCQQALETKVNHNIEYKKSGEYLISPGPQWTPPFMAYCDFDTVPGKGLTIIKPNFPPEKPVTDPTDPVDVPYRGPTDAQIRTLVGYSSHCYQAVKVECQGTEFLKPSDAYWNAAGASRKNAFWGGGERRGSSGVCACGTTGECGGTDSYSGQAARKCNCDFADDTKRSDAGIMDQKNDLPLGQFHLGQNSKFGSLNFTVGDLICARTKLTFNECDMGYHDCHPMATCEDRTDGYSCVCKKGWEGKSGTPRFDAPRANGRECIDDDECSWNPCSHTAICHNTPGSFYCTCKPGYRKSDPLTCVDIDECKENTHDCHENARCENLVGSYRCACKKGYRGDGRTCKGVGECKCFGDPHCLSFDSRWLHYQGLCEYIMSKDNCDSDEAPTYQVWTKYWRRGSKRPGYYSYVESVRVIVGDLEIKLGQGKAITVNGIYHDQFLNPDGVSVIKSFRSVVVRAPNGLEVSWDGKDAVTVVVPDNRKDSTCGICGNYNSDPTDDWTVGETCVEKEGTVTDNFELFGNSWTLISNTSGPVCDVDCDPEVPPDPRDCENKELIELKCSELLNVNTSPFKQCLALMSKEDREQFLMSCSYDLCFADSDFHGSVCRFAETLSEECTTKYKTVLTTWRDNVESCEPKECENNMQYTTCGPVRQETCMTLRTSIPVGSNPNECYEGCICAEGLVMDADKCIPEEDCGCIYNNQYIQKGDIVVNPDCQTFVKCEGNDTITSDRVNCKDNEECSVGEDGKPGCYCVEGFMLNEMLECVVDPCYNVSCPMNNTECVQGECQCSMGFIGDCNSCMNVDECATGTADCNKLGQKCTDLIGSFLCLCQPGFIMDKDGNCEDIDECATFTDRCGSNAECSNTLGSYSCECCSGYKKNNKGNCVRDFSQPKGSCCACKGDKCTKPGKVCGSDGTTYQDYRSLAVASCRTDKDIKVDYPGECQGTCETVKCKIPYQTCKPDEAGKPTCGCPSCEDSSSEVISETVCATNKVTYTSICHMKASTCEAELEIQVEVETIGKPCGEGNPIYAAGPWSDFGPCSETCKEGVRNRTREVGITGLSAVEEIPCNPTCSEGPCTLSTCKKPGQVCTADVNNVPSCKCPVCGAFPEQPVCARVGNVIQTFDNPCLVEAEACANEEEDYVILEPRACEDKPEKCGKIRRFHLYVDDDGCRANRPIDFGSCYGGCDNMGEKCCFPDTVQRTLVLTCPDFSFRKVQVDVTESCSCIDNEEAERRRNGENAMEVV